MKYNPPLTDRSDVELATAQNHCAELRNEIEKIAQNSHEKGWNDVRDIFERDATAIAQEIDRRNSNFYDNRENEISGIVETLFSWPAASQKGSLTVENAMIEWRQTVDDILDESLFDPVEYYQDRVCRFINIATDEFEIEISYYDEREASRHNEPYYPTCGGVEIELTVNGDDTKAREWLIAAGVDDNR